MMCNVGLLKILPCPRSRALGPTSQAAPVCHAKFYRHGAGLSSPGNDNQPSSPLNRLKLQNRRSAPTGFTKSNMTATELSSAGTAPRCGYSRNAHDWTVRLAAIAAAAGHGQEPHDGEAVVLGPDGLSLFDELRRREAARTAILYAFDLIEYDGQDLRNLPFLDRKAALARHYAAPRWASF
jgi:hypothetical protein